MSRFSKAQNKDGDRALRAALFVIERLRASGHRALLAGGCVRDMLLSRPPKDYDVVTDAVPPRICELFPNARTVGAKFGVVLVRKFSASIEVATFRTDGTYTDGRRPDEVTFGGERDDALRRDFTINGLFYDPTTETVIDHVQGRADLVAGVIRTIGDANRRFAEDHLRMLRAVRFATVLGFNVHDATLRAICAQAPQLSTISAERIWQELSLVLIHPARETGWTLCRQCGLTPYLAQGWPVQETTDATTVRRLGALPDESIPPTLGLAALLLGVSETTRARVRCSMRLSNKQAGAVRYLCAAVQRLAGASIELADLKELMASADWPCALQLLRADLLARNENVHLYEEICERARRVPTHEIAPPPLVTGDDLVSAGATPGPAMGNALRQVYRAQLSGTVTSAQEARQMAMRLIAEA